MAGSLQLAPAAGSAAAPFAERSRFARIRGAIWRLCRKKPLGAAGGAVVIALIIVAIVPGLFAPQAFDDFNVRARYKGPSAVHVFGTDDQGRDVFSRVVYGARSSVLIGFGAVAISTVLSTVIGLFCGYYGGAVDLVVQRIVDTWQAFPSLIFIIFLVAIFGHSTWTVITAVGLLFSAGASRVVRSVAITVKSSTYIEASRATGAGDLRMLWSHLLPNVLPIVLINASVQIGAVILLEASLSFLGFGIPPPFPSWGRMLQDAQIEMQRHPYLAFFPGGAIALTVYSFSMFGDAVRDTLDPRLRGG